MNRLYCESVVLRIALTPTLYVSVAAIVMFVAEKLFIFPFCNGSHCIKKRCSPIEVSQALLRIGMEMMHKVPK